MTLCCQVTNYPINALEREEIHPTYIGSNNFPGPGRYAKTYLRRQGIRSPLDAYEGV